MKTNQQKQQILTLEKLKPADVWHFQQKLDKYDKRN